MPGIMFHTDFANVVYNKLKGIINLDKVSFYGANLVVDLAKEKGKSHYRIPSSIPSLFEVPDMEKVKKDLFDPHDPVKFGIYCHLYLDYYFIVNYLIPSFIWDIKNQTVTNRKNSIVWDIETFFSQDGMYGSYTEINTLLVANGRVPMDIIDSIPEVFPDTGIPVYDDRWEKTWRQELDEYFAERKVYTGTIFNFDEFCEFIDKTAEQLVCEVKEALS